MKDLKKIMDSTFSVIVILFIILASYTAGNYRGQKHVHSKYQKTMDSILVDNKNWWIKLRQKTAEVDDALSGYYTREAADEFENHSEIKE